jgi:hypothetical protein
MTVGDPHDHRADQESNRTGPARSQLRADGSICDLSPSHS